MTSEEINKLFREHGLTLGSVESFTGGLFAKEITSVPGASHFFKGAVVTYATEEKNRLLGIPYEDIDQYGLPASGDIAAAVQKRCFENKLIVEKGGRNGSVMRCLCALNISDEDLKKAMDIFEEAVIAVNKKYGK